MEESPQLPLNPSLMCRADNAPVTTAIGALLVVNRLSRALHSVWLSVMLGANRLLPCSLASDTAGQGMPSMYPNAGGLSQTRFVAAASGLHRGKGWKRI